MWWKSRKKNESENLVSENKELREAGRAPLSEVAKKVKHVELASKKRSSAQLLGQYKSRFRGQGMQFSDFRVYQFGDDIRHIDWRTTARSQQTYVRTYDEERELNIICAVDISGSGLFGSQGETKRNLLCLGIANIAFSAVESNDRVGLLLFSDQIERYVPPKKGRKHVMRILDELLSFKPKHTGTDFRQALQFLSRVTKHNSVVVVASDFFTHLERRQLSTIARKHDLIAMHVQDPRDIHIPAIGLVELEDPESGERLTIDASSSLIQNQLSQGLLRQLHDTLKVLQKSGASLISLETNKDPSQEIRKFFQRRKRAKK